MTSMLEVRVSNFAAIALYHRFGYHEVGIRKTITRTTTKMPSCLTWIKLTQTN